MPWTEITASTMSRVVPACEVTIARSLRVHAFKRLDFPTFGRPTMATCTIASGEEQAHCSITAQRTFTPVVSKHPRYAACRMSVIFRCSSEALREGVSVQEAGVSEKPKPCSQVLFVKRLKLVFEVESAPCTERWQGLRMVFNAPCFQFCNEAHALAPHPFDRRAEPSYNEGQTTAKSQEGSPLVNSCYWVKTNPHLAGRKARCQLPPQSAMR